MLQRLKSRVFSFLNDSKIRRAAFIAKAFRDTKELTERQSQQLQNKLSSAAFAGPNSPYSRRSLDRVAFPETPVDGSLFAEMCDVWDIPYGAKVLIVGELGRNFFDAISRKRPDVFLWTYDPKQGLFPDGPLHWARFNIIIFPATAGHFDLAGLFFACEQLLRPAGAICVFDYTTVDHPSYYLSHLDYRVRALATWTGLANEAGFNYSACEQVTDLCSRFQDLNAVRSRNLIARFTKERAS